MKRKKKHTSKPKPKPKPFVKAPVIMRLRKGRPKKIPASGSHIDRFHRILEVAERLAQGFYKSEIKFFLKKKYGIKFRAAENYILRAKGMLRTALDETLVEQKSKSLATYRSVLRTSNDPRFKIQAQQQIDRLLGLQAPIRLETSTAEEADAVTKLCQELEKNPILVKQIIDGPDTNVTIQATKESIGAPISDSLRSGSESREVPPSAAPSIA